MDFAKYLRQTDVSEDSKVCIVDFYEMDFMKGTVTLVNVDGISLLRRLLRPFFIKGQASYRKRYSCRERVWYCNIDGTGAVSSEIQGNRNGWKK